MGDVPLVTTVEIRGFMDSLQYFAEAGFLRRPGVHGGWC